jgi:hypothetical protein
MKPEERRLISNLMISLALYLPQIIHSTSPLLNISLLYSASVSQILQFTPLDNPLPSAYTYDRPTSGKNKYKKIDMGFAFPLFLANEILFKLEPRGNERASKIRSLPRKTDSCKQHGTLRKTRNMYRRVTYKKKPRK